jgi:hypothetical protein
MYFNVEELYEEMAKHIQIYEKFKNSGRIDIEEERRLDSNKMKSIMSWISELTKLYDTQQQLEMKAFLMPVEWNHFQEWFTAKNRDPDFDDYKKFKIEQSKTFVLNYYFNNMPERLVSIFS